MAEGIILSSGSIGTKPEDLTAVLEQHGYEVDQPEVQEPKREDFQDDESFNAAVAAHQEEHPANNGRSDSKTQPEKKTRIQRAVDKHTEELRNKVKALETENAELKKPKAAEPSKPVMVKPEVEAKKPVRADFPQGDAGQEQFEDALFDWRSDQKNKKENQKTEAAQETQEREASNKHVQESFERYHQRKDEFKKTVSDWDTLAEASNEVPLMVPAKIAIAELENGPQVMYYLMQHHDFARELDKLSPLSAVMEIGRLSERLKSSSSSRANGGNSEQKKVRLPEPVKPVSTAATASTLTTADAAANGNFRAFKAARRRGH